MNRLALLIAFLSISAAAYVAYTAEAWPHEAPTGWSYPFLCCSNFDCREVAATAIGEGSTGYTIKATGEVLGFSDARLKDSPDGRFHWCSVAGADNSRTICLFVPPRSF